MPVDGPVTRAPWTLKGPSEPTDLFSHAFEATTSVSPAAPLAPGLHDIEVDKIVVPSDRRELLGTVDLTESISAVGWPSFLLCSKTMARPWTSEMRLRWLRPSSGSS